MKTKVILSNSIIPPIKPYNIWHSPLNVYWHIDQLTKKVGADAIEKKTEYQMVREARMGAVLALAMFKKLHKPTYIQLYKPDPPDIILMQPSGEHLETRDITQVEITTYIGKPRQTLLEQLKARKIPPGIPSFSENYILVVNVGIGIEIDPKPIGDYLQENKNVFPVVLLQQKEAHPDTIARMIWINPGDFYETEANIGEAAHEFREKSRFKAKGFFDIVQSKRAGSLKYVRQEVAEKSYDAPWETIGK